MTHGLPSRSLAAILLLPGLVFAAGGQKDKQPATYTIPLPPRPDFSSLDWIMGDWAGHTTDPTTGKETQGDVHLTFSYVLDKRFVSVKEEVSLPAAAAAPAVHEAWTGFLSGDPAGHGFILRAFSSTGFMTEYHVTVTDDRIRFDPEGGADPPPGWLFRRVISRLGPAFFAENVEVAPPGGSFFVYYAAKLTQVLPSKPALPPASGVKPASSAPPSPGRFGSR